MPLFEEKNNPNNQNQTFQNNQINNPPLQVKEESGIIKTIGQLLPLAPFVFEQFTGQKVPQMSGTMADISLSLQQIQLSLQTLANNQQTLSQRITNLENSAVQQLTSLNNQFNSLRLTHTKERKEIAYNNSSRLEEENQEY